MEYNFVARRVSGPGIEPAVSVQVSRGTCLNFARLVEALVSVAYAYGLPDITAEYLAGNLERNYDELLEVTELALEHTIGPGFVDEAGQSIQIKIMGYE